MAIPTIEEVKFDFEQYALTEGIPEIKDPLPYRAKSRSIFVSKNTTASTRADFGDAITSNKSNRKEQPATLLTSAKNDPRLRTVVCRHWLKGLCMKGTECEFLHQYDLSKMPYCYDGQSCPNIRHCPFRHLKESDRSECIFYNQGFCVHGRLCRYKHIRRERADLPVVADFTLGIKHKTNNDDSNNSEQQKTKRRRLAYRNNSQNEFFKSQLCKHFIQHGECPFGNECHFAHGKSDLRPLAKQ